MPLWKQRMFARLQRPLEGEGEDLGGGAPDAGTEAAADPADDAPAGDDAPDAGQDSTPMEAMTSFLDKLTDDPNKPAADAPAGEQPAQVEQKADAPAPAAEQTKTTEQEEAELLEGVKSERGRERIQRVFAERKQLEQDLGDFRQMVRSTGMTADEFAQSLEFGRLAKSDDPQQLAVALEMVEAQRAQLYQRLGREAPGVDLLQGHDDLRQAVDNMEISRERAVELASLRRTQQQQRQQQQVARQAELSNQEFNTSMQQASQAMEQYLASRVNEADHPARMSALTAHFKDPARMQEFVSTYTTPQQMLAAVKFMYDNIRVAPPAQQPVRREQPIRSRPAALGTPAPGGDTPADRLAARMEQMGL